MHDEDGDTFQLMSGEARKNSVGSGLRRTFVLRGEQELSKDEGCRRNNSARCQANVLTGPLADGRHVTVGEEGRGCAVAYVKLTDGRLEPRCGHQWQGRRHNDPHQDCKQNDDSIPSEHGMTIGFLVERVNVKFKFDILLCGLGADRPSRMDSCSKQTRRQPLVAQFYGEIGKFTVDTF